MKTTPSTPPSSTASAGSAPAAPASRADQVRVALSDEIAAGALPAGARLDEAALAARFGVSRTPIREALKQLDAIGLVARGPRRTQLVAAIAPQELGRMFEFMAEMEALCARLAAANMDAHARRGLERRQQACRAAVQDADPACYAEADAAFHQAIYQGTRNRYVIESTERIWRRLSPFRRHQLLTGARLVASQREHEAILTAVLQGNAEAAGSLTRDHILAVRDSFALGAAAGAAASGRGK